ncbi:MAG: polymorphic toxin-type HINT domain-containing protein [Terrisporobacter sp.]|uniref:polymorphic toxin-type HINT domain-containing protein n=1 Tax=Terrisporobacter sp. TaxID=1965305 RepID=UPI002FC72A6D
MVGVEGKSEVSYEYTDFAETEIKGDENFFNEICYIGGIYDKKTGLYYLNARYYNPEDGRFLTEDTYRGENSDPSSLHLYAYCANNPIAYKDPSGHIPVWGIINAAWGAYDGYNYAKKKNLKGWKKAGAIVGGAVISTVNPFKKLKVGKVARRVSKIAKKRKSTKVIAKRVTKAAKKVAKKSKKVKKSASRTYAKVKCKITKKGCFTAGTLISTEDGLVSIEDVKEGDLVWAQDPETGEVALKPVVQTFVKETDTILYIKTAGEIIEATEQHVFFIDGVGWIPASMIEEGDVVVLQSGEKVEVESIDKVLHNELVTVFNFEVEDFHTYFVSDANVLVHNNGCKYQVGAYKDIKGSKGLDAHHAGQKALMKKVVNNYDEMTAPAINVPKVGHTIKGDKGIVSRKTRGINNARQLLARDIKELRRVYPDIPNSKLKELINMNKKLYPEMRKK